jgi:hypothetical protein
MGVTTALFPVGVQVVAVGDIDLEPAGEAGERPREILAEAGFSAAAETTA